MAEPHDVSWQCGCVTTTQPVDNESIPSRIAQQASDAEVNERVGNVPLTSGEYAAVHPRTAPHFYLSSDGTENFRQAIEFA